MRNSSEPSHNNGVANKNQQEGAQIIGSPRSDGEDSPIEEEPDWESITHHDPARTEVPIFLNARDRREESNNRYTSAIEELDQSMSHSMGELVQTVESLVNDRSEKLYEYEQNLKSDYVYNEKMRASMQAKLEESARAAQGFFANLLMRIAQPDDAGSGQAGNSNETENQNPKVGSPINREDLGDDEPDWDNITQHEPAKTEVPKFLTARDRRAACDARFSNAIEEYQNAVDCYYKELMQTVADMYNSRSMKMDEYEQQLKQDYVSNDEMRADMQSKLEESATAAHNMFEALMRRVMQPPSIGDSIRSLPQDVP